MMRSKEIEISRLVPHMLILSTNLSMCVFKVHFFQTLTLVGFLRLFVPRLITDDNRWVDEEDM